VIVIWPFTGSRTRSEPAEARAQKAVVISFWLLAPYVAIESIRNLLFREMPETTFLGSGRTISSLLLMPMLGIAKQRLGDRRRGRSPIAAHPWDKGALPSLKDAF
jgi:hypothetical protein